MFYRYKKECAGKGNTAGKKERSELKPVRNTKCPTMGSLTPLASSPKDHGRSNRKYHLSASSAASPSLSTSSTSWLLIAAGLLVLGVLTVGSLLLYVALNAASFESPPAVHAQRTEAQILRAERLADSLGEKGKLVIDLVIKEEAKYGAAVEGGRQKRSPLTSSGSTFMEGSSDPTKMFLRRYDENFDYPKGQCRKRSLPMCNGHVPFNSTTYPNFIGDANETEANRSLPYFNYIAKSRCNRRIKQLLCAFLEPACDNGRAVPPCKKFCRIALEGCAEYIPATLELSAAFDCRRYPDSTDPRVCVNLAMGKGCQADEFQCPDRSCVPRHWTCDGVRDCIFAADEANCAGVGEFLGARLLSMVLPYF